MPKEVIYGEALPYGTPEEPGPARSAVEVRWNRETGYFQIATKCVEAATGEDYVPPLDPIEEMPVIMDGEQPVGFVLGDLVELQGTRSQSGWYVDLDRKGINDLIRVLRKARDQAFGRDE